MAVIVITSSSSSSSGAGVSTSSSSYTGSSSLISVSNSSSPCNLNTSCTQSSKDGRVAILLVVAAIPHRSGQGENTLKVHQKSNDDEPQTELRPDPGSETESLLH